MTRTAPILALLPSLLGAAVLEDFSAAPAISLVRASERGVIASCETPPGGEGKALLLRYAEKHNGLNEVYFVKPLPIPGPGTVTMRARMIGPIGVWGVALRVIDAEGECFQFRADKAPGEAWTVLTFAVDPAKQAGHWGNPGNGTMDGTWKVAGLAADGADKPGAGELWFDDLAFEPAATK